jgi:chemotaxis protein methyltransferase CheR
LLSELLTTHNHYLLATDLDRGALVKAKARGPYTAEDIRNVSIDERSRYFEAGGPPFFVTEKLSQLVTFREQDMLLDQFEDGFDLIVCRNVIIYFTTEAKNILYNKFSRALRPGGILFLGGTEIIPKPQEFSLLGQGFSFYKKVQIAA